MSSKPARGSLASMAVPKAVSSSPAPAVSTPEAEAPRQETKQSAEPTPRRAPIDMKTVQVRINKAGCTILLVEQNTRKAMQVASRAAVLRLGEVIWTGPPDSISMGQLGEIFMTGKLPAVL